MSFSKQLWLLAGGNGAGKSTFYRLFLEPRKIMFVNADEIARKLAPNNPEKVSYQAAIIAEKLRDDLLEQGSSFCYETVFSHESKIDLVAKANARGYKIILIYIHLDTPALNEGRVQQRVAEGGHSVPTDKIYSRIPRTMRNIAVVLPLVDEAWLLNNSSRDNPFRQVAVVKKGRLKEQVDPLPDWAKVILTNVSD